MKHLLGLVNKTYHDAKILETKEKYFNFYDYNKLTGDILDANIIQKKSINLIFVNSYKILTKIDAITNRTK